MGSLSLCAHCGVFVAGQRRCPECDRPLPRPALVVPEGGPRFVRASFAVRCEACREDTPVLRPDAARVECVACGEAVAIEPEGVARSLRFAGDVGARPPATRGDDRRDFGLAIDARRGYPSCVACERPFSVRDGASSAAPFALVCDGCGVGREAWPAPRGSAAHPGLRAVLPASSIARDDAGRTVALTAPRSGEARVTALVCPACAGALSTPDAATGLIACAYCKTLCHVATAPASRVESPPDYVWLAFDEAAASRAGRAKA